MADSLAIELGKLLDEYSREVRETAEKDIEAVAKETAERLKATSPKNTGKYAKGWAVKKNGKDIVVHNRTKPGLTHLLEKGHAKVSGGRVPGKAHIAPAEEWAAEELARRIERDL